MMGGWDRILEAGAEAEPWRKAAYWLSPHGLLSLHSYIPQDQHPRGATLIAILIKVHTELGHPTTATKKIPHRFLYRPMLLRHFSIAGPSSQTTQACVKLT